MSTSDHAALATPSFTPGATRLGARATAACALLAAVVGASGLLLGFAWYKVAPRIQLIKVEGGGLVYAEPEPEQAVAADGWFAILGVGAGVLFALLAWFVLRRWRGPAVLVALTLGSLVAALLAAWLGHRLGLADLRAARAAAAVGDRIAGPLVLRVMGLPVGELDQGWRPTLVGVIPLQALSAAFVYACLAGFSRYGSLRGPDRRIALQSYPLLLGATDQFGPGRTGSSDSGTGVART